MPQHGYDASLPRGIIPAAAATNAPTTSASTAATVRLSLDASRFPYSMLSPSTTGVSIHLLRFLPLLSPVPFWALGVGVTTPAYTAATSPTPSVGFAMTYICFRSDMTGILQPHRHRLDVVLRPRAG
jgi:hypothetical protein